MPLSMDLFLSDCFIIIIRKWAEAHEQLPEGQHDDTSALLQHHEEVFSCYIWWCVLILNIYWHDTSAYFIKNYSQHFIKLKEPTFASLTRFAGILTKWWSISKMKNGLSGQGKLYHVINLRNVFRDVEQFSNRLANHFLSLGFKWVELRALS